MTGISKAKARRSARNKSAGITYRRKLGLPAKAGKNRPPHIRSERDKKTGKRNWIPA